MKKGFFQNIKLLSLALIIGLSVSYALAWTGPTSNPPSNNVAGPINVSSVAQIKAGALKVGGLRSFLPSYINFDSNTDLTQKAAPFQALALAVNGKVGASEYCDQDGNNCVNTAGGSLSGGSCTPYDSGWVTVGPNSFAKTFHHNLGTLDTMVYYELKGNKDFTVQNGTSPVMIAGEPHNYDSTSYFSFYNKTENDVSLRGFQSNDSGDVDQVRVIVYKISCL